MLSSVTHSEFFHILFQYLKCIIILCHKRLSVEAERVQVNHRLNVVHVLPKLAEGGSLREAVAGSIIQICPHTTLRVNGAIHARGMG